MFYFPAIEQGRGVDRASEERAEDECNQDWGDPIHRGPNMLTFESDVLMSE